MTLPKYLNPFRIYRRVSNEATRAINLAKLKIFRGHFSDPNNFDFGTYDWLVAAEQKYGGYHQDVIRTVVSEHDPRSQEQLDKGGMTGGDRMIVHGYGKYYAKYLKPFVRRRTEPLVIVEIGVLKGLGLAVWSELFPNAEIIGLDIDPSNVKNNLNNLKDLGAFKYSDPEIYKFDQFVDGKNRIREILGKRKVDIYIDDGFHSDETITNSFTAIESFLSRDFVAFIEDNRTVMSYLKTYQGKKWKRFGELIVGVRDV